MSAVRLASHKVYNYYILCVRLVSRLSSDLISHTHQLGLLCMLNVM